MTLRPACLTALLLIALMPLRPASAQSNTATDLFTDLPDFTSTPVPPASTPPITQPAQAEPAAEPRPIQPLNTPPLPSAEKPPPSAPPVGLTTLLNCAKKAYAEGRWNDAQAIYEAVLRTDSYNQEAINTLDRIAKKKSAREGRSYETTRSRMLETVQAAWNTPKVEGNIPGDLAPQRELTDREKQSADLRDRLEALRIPALSFENAALQQVVAELSAWCRPGLGQKGINLAVFGADGADLPTITFSGTDLSVLEALDIVTQMAGMKYEIGPNLVSLTPVGYEPPQQMVAAEFDLIPSVGSKLTGRGEAVRGQLDVRDFFSTIPFPPGARAQFNPEFNVLLIRNSPKHIEQIAALLDRYARKASEEQSRQIEIETKFIEVSQGALDELGFDWTIGTPGEYITSDEWTMPGGQKIFTDTLRTGQEAFSRDVSPAGRASEFNRYAQILADPTGTGLIDTAGELLIQKVKGDLKVDLLIRALENTAGVDLLYEPKILTKNGETANIHVGEVHWYPTAFDVALERYSQPSLIPLDYQEEQTGVMLEVTPELDSENGTITLKLAPEIRELAGFDEQHVGTIWPEYGNESLDMNSDTPANNALIDFLTLREQSRTTYADRLIARRPIFKSRKVNTSVTIDDGSTLAMGGLIKEKLETFKDSVPILGKIPLLGWLFRSEGERTTKRNLLIFVTAGQVNASGYRQAVH